MLQFDTWKSRYENKEKLIFLDHKQAIASLFS